MTLPKKFKFLTDPSFDSDIKKILLQGLLEEERHKRDSDLKASEAQDSHAFEKKKYWHNTPLALALVGTISVFVNGLVTYVQAPRPTSDTITLKELDARLRESEKRSDDVRERQLLRLKQEMVAQIQRNVDTIESEKDNSPDELGASTEVAKFSLPNGGTIRIRASEVRYVRESLPTETGSTVVDLGGDRKEVVENVNTVLARLNANPPLAKLTAPDGKPVWIRGGFVIGVSDSHGIMAPSAHAIVYF